VVPPAGTAEPIPPVRWRRRLAREDASHSARGALEDVDPEARGEADQAPDQHLPDGEVRERDVLGDLRVEEEGAEPGHDEGDPPSHVHPPRDARARVRPAPLDASPRSRRTTAGGRLHSPTPHSCVPAVGVGVTEGPGLPASRGAMRRPAGTPGPDEERARAESLREAGGYAISAPRRAPRWRRRARAPGRA